MIYSADSLECKTFLVFFVSGHEKSESAAVPLHFIWREHEAISEHGLVELVHLMRPTQTASTLLCLSLVSSPTRHLSCPMAEQFRDDWVTLLFWWLRRGVSLWTSRDAGVWRRLRRHPLWSVPSKSCDFFQDENKPVCIVHVSVNLDYLPLFQQG